MEKLREMALEAYDRFIGLDLSEVVVDCCITKAPCGGEKAGRSPVDRGKQGTKRSTAVDGRGIPVDAVMAPANRHDSPLLSETLDAVTETLGELPGGAKVHLDRGYDSKATRERLEERGLMGEISKRRASRPRLGPRDVGSWSVPTRRGTTSTKSWCGVLSVRGGSSTSGWRSLTW
jgi:hypothetical protein